MNIYESLQKYFGYSSFKEGQKVLVDAILKGKDALGIMPTGGGKSLCYQLPALYLPGITLVISPLISLMKDQVDSLDQVGIPSTFINSSLSDKTFIERLNKIRNNEYKLVYVAPERLDTLSFDNLVSDIEISLIAVDEAHCISQWGHDFRPAYRQIPNFIASLNKRPIVSAYTATATKAVITDIENILKLNKPTKSLVGFDRPNLYYSVVKTGDKYSYLKDFIDRFHKGQSGIIYCSTRKTVESLSSRLEKDGYLAMGYHGGMASGYREDVQNKFILGDIDIIVATNAFGMGIDKPDVRYVIHYNMPQNMESYYQEAGRAGRDGEDSNCLLMYSPGDIVQQKLLIQNQVFSNEREFLLYENLQYLIDYCHTNTCLRVKILEYFDEIVDFTNCNNCSNCLDESEMLDITLEAQKILSCIYRVEERYGVTMVIQVLRGSKNKRILENNLDKVSTYGIMKDYSNETIREIIMTLISRDYIYMTADRYPTLELTNKSKEVLNSEVRIYHKKKLLQASEPKKDKSEVLKNLDHKLLDKLKDTRAMLAKENNIPPFMVFHDSSLKEMASFMPRSKEDLLTIKGVGDKKYESFGLDFLNTINEYMDGFNLSNPPNLSPKIETLEERYQSTYSLYKEGMDLKTMADKRNYTENTIINHLSKAEASGMEVDWSRFLDGTKEETIISTINKLGLDSLKNIKDKLPEDFTYQDINICIIKNKIGS